jgi:predicted nucleic acid-binding protein
MILYLDTSALLKKYYKEVGSEEIIESWKAATEIAISSIAYAETMASFHRKRREKQTPPKASSPVFESFQKDWESFIRIEVTDNLNESIKRISAAYPLRGFDAIHLASALLINERVPEGFLFACFDKILLKAAQGEGLETLPVSADDGHGSG